MTTIDLVDRARRGDRQAFDALAAGVLDRLYSVARLILRDADRAEDAGAIEQWPLHARGKAHRTT